MSNDSDDLSKPWADPSPVEHGGRVELRLVESENGQTRYLARWFTPNESLDGQVSISDGVPNVTIDSPPELPEWLASFTTSLVRTTARRANEDGAWPRRLTRWRQAPKGKTRDSQEE